MIISGMNLLRFLILWVLWICFVIHPVYAFEQIPNEQLDLTVEYEEELNAEEILLNENAAKEIHKDTVSTNKTAKNEAVTDETTKTEAADIETEKKKIIKSEMEKDADAEELVIGETAKERNTEELVMDETKEDINNSSFFDSSKGNQNRYERLQKNELLKAEDTCAKLQHEINELNLLKQELEKHVRKNDTSYCLENASSELYGHYNYVIMSWIKDFFVITAIVFVCVSMLIGSMYGIIYFKNKQS